jgi:hypothetical protein
MKGYQEFKGYSTRLEFNSESKTFEEASIPHAFLQQSNLASSFVNFAKGKIQALRDRRLLSRMSERDLNEIGMDDRRNSACNDPHWGVQVRSRNSSRQR